MADRSPAVVSRRDLLPNDAHEMARDYRPCICASHDGSRSVPCRFIGKIPSHASREGSTTDVPENATWSELKRRGHRSVLHQWGVG